MDTTQAHRGPARPQGPARRKALVAVHPRAVAIPLPDSGVKVGRSWLAEHGLADGEVSGAHLRFNRAGGRVRVADLGSRNGTWVQGQPLSPNVEVSLDDGATLRLGRTLFVYRDGLEGELSPDPPLGPPARAMVSPWGLRPLRRTLAALAAAPSRNVLVEGATGTGKELTARAVAAALGRPEPFAPVNVAAVAEGVFEGQLFGHVEGAFSGAGKAAAGIVRAHDGGTVFLDEIGELPEGLQPKLLRLLDNREVFPVGAERPVVVDVAVVAATNQPLEELVEAGRFRADLYARLAQTRIELPELADRPEDVVALAESLAGPWPEEAVEVEALERLLLASWPRNVRQLAAVLGEAGRLDDEPGLRLWAVDRALGEEGAPDVSGLLTEARVEAALEASEGNVTAAARALGVSRGKLLRFRKQTGK